MNSHTAWLFDDLKPDDRARVTRFIERLHKAANPCAYPDCVNYKKGAKSYCCNGCSWDHEDWKRLRERKT